MSEWISSADVLIMVLLLMETKEVGILKGYIHILGWLNYFHFALKATIFGEILME
jgi:hypothetical protein